LVDRLSECRRAVGSNECVGQAVRSYRAIRWTACELIDAEYWPPLPPFNLGSGSSITTDERVRLNAGRRDRHPNRETVLTGANRTASAVLGWDEPPRLGASGGADDPVRQKQRLVARKPSGIASDE
jgi:hypothetical protein